MFRIFSTIFPINIPNKNLRINLIKCFQNSTFNEILVGSHVYMPCPISMNPLTLSQVSEPRVHPIHFPLPRGRRTRPGRLRLSRPRRDPLAMVERPAGVADTRPDEPRIRHRRVHAQAPVHHGARVQCLEHGPR